MKSKLHLIAGVLALFGMLNSAHAQTNVSWASHMVTGDSDVLTSGDGYQLLSAVDFLPAGDNVYDPGLVNGVQFTLGYANTTSVWTNNGVTLTLIGSGGVAGAGYDTYFHGNGNPTYLALPTDYQYFLVGSAFGQAAGGITFQLTGLTAGTNYEVRFWNNNNYASSPAPADWSLNSIDGVTIDQSATTTGTVGSYITVTFTADGETETFNGTGYGPALNAVEILEAVAAPEPSSVALMAAGVGLVGLIAVRRFRLAAV
jgi:hypothetical protein